MESTKISARLRRLTKADILVIAANLIPVLGVAFWGWSAVEAFTVYAMETLIVGIITVLKLLVATFARNAHSRRNGESSVVPGGIFITLFFIVHFGIFAMVQTSIFSGVADIGPRNAGPLYFFLNWYKFLNEHTSYALAAFVVSYIGSNFVPFMVSGDYKTAPVMQIMIQPYGRIFVQQFTVILGSMMLLFKFGIGFMVVFVAAKLYIDLFMNLAAVTDRSTT